ncbi:MAG: NUDIX hydrolase [Pyrinomonadaceae bacterium]
MRNREPEVLSIKEIYRGRVFDVTLDTIKEGDLTYTREIVHHPGSAVILPVYPDGTVGMVRQYRHPARKFLLELPAGSLHDGEPPEHGAERELTEELGVRAGSLEKLTEFFISPGFLEEKMFLFLATDLSDAEQNLDDDEVIDIVRVTISQALEMITIGEIEDAKTIIGILVAAPRLTSQTGVNYPAV